MEGVAAGNPLHPQENTPERAVFPHRLVGIGGTTGHVPAMGRKMGRHRLLIKPNHKHYRFLRYRHYSVPASKPARKNNVLS
jgi:hypothetical protein